MTTLSVWVCACETPATYTRPSGIVICQACGLPIVEQKTPEPRP